MSVPLWHSWRKCTTVKNNRQYKYGDIDMNKDRPATSFEGRLRTARQTLRGMTQVDLARATGLPASSIAHFEGGGRKPSFDNLRKLANALDVTTDYLLGRIDAPNVAEPADPIYRYGSQLTRADRSLAEDFLRMLAEREHERSKHRESKS